jgi:cell wall-associated NlpC family hydrolase
MARRALIACLCALVLAAPASAGPSAASWALPQIKLVTAHGLMGGKASGFRPDDALTAGDLGDLVAGLTGQEAPMAAGPSTPVTIAELDAQLVRALGLLPSARFFTAQVRAAGITPTRYFGTEVTARLIGLRVDHPAAQDALERGPSDVATRAEAAYSAAHILGFTGGEANWVAQQAGTFQLPALSGNQRAILQVALSLVGYPYIWGGTSELPQDPFATGKLVPGGFDCSGFVWRVYKLQAYTGGGNPGATLKGRTTYAMSDEVPRAKRIGIAKLQPADLLFFGSAGPKSKPADINHMGIYLGGGWFVQASSQGVSLSTLSSPWYAKRFAWARRPLAEAGLT